MKKGGDNRFCSIEWSVLERMDENNRWLLLHQRYGLNQIYLHLSHFRSFPIFSPAHARVLHLSWTNYVLFPDFGRFSYAFLLGTSIEQARDHWMENGSGLDKAIRCHSNTPNSIHTKQLNFSEYSEWQLRERSMCVCEVCTLLLNSLPLFEWKII